MVLVHPFGHCQFEQRMKPLGLTRRFVLLQFGPRELTMNRSQRCVSGNQGRVCRPKRSLLLGLHPTEKTSWTFGVMVCAVHLHVLGSYIDCKGEGRFVGGGLGCHDELGRETCHICQPLGKVKTCGLSVGNVMGYPGVFQGNLHPYLSKPAPASTGAGFHRYG